MESKQTYIAVVTLTALSFFTMIALAQFSSPTESYVNALSVSGVNFVYSSEGRVTLVRTAETSDEVDKLLATKPDNVIITVIEGVDRPAESDKVGACDSDRK